MPLVLLHWRELPLALGGNNVSDAYSSVRGLPFPQLAGLLGIDLQRFKRRKEDWQGY